MAIASWHEKFTTQSQVLTSLIEKTSENIMVNGIMSIPCNVFYPENVALMVNR